MFYSHILREADNAKQTESQSTCHYLSNNKKSDPALRDGKLLLIEGQNLQVITVNYGPFLSYQGRRRNIFDITGEVYLEFLLSILAHLFERNAHFLSTNKNVYSRNIQANQAVLQIHIHVCKPAVCVRRRQTAVRMYFGQSKGLVFFHACYNGTTGLLQCFDCCAQYFLRIPPRVGCSFGNFLLRWPCILCVP